LYTFLSSKKKQVNLDEELGVGQAISQEELETA